MYYYILDNHNIPQKDFERNQTELQSLLTEFKISGEMVRVTPLRIIPDLVDVAANRGVKTLVACGTDETFHQMLAAVKDLDFTLSFIPFTQKTQLGKILGFKDIPSAIKSIAGRRIEKIDAAKISTAYSNNYFISYLEIGLANQTNKPVGIFPLMKLFASNPISVKMRIDDSYNIESKIMGGLIINTRGTGDDLNNYIGNPQDGYLDLVMIEKMGKLTVAKNRDHILKGSYEKIPGATSIRCQKIEIFEPNNLKIYIDGKEFAKAPATIEIIPQKLRMIVGKNRTF